MSQSPFRVEALHNQDRSQFGCGIDALDQYLRLHATQDVRRNVSMCYVAIDAATDFLAGYYTLAAAGVPLTELPRETTRRLPRYPMVPAVRIGRLAVDKRYAGRGLGGALLFDAAHRTQRSGIAAFAVVVDAKNENAVSFYEHHGFQRFSSSSQTLFLPIKDAIKPAR